MSAADNVSKSVSPATVLLTIGIEIVYQFTIVYKLLNRISFILTCYVTVTSIIIHIIQWNTPFFINFIDTRYWWIWHNKYITLVIFIDLTVKNGIRYSYEQCAVNMWNSNYTQKGHTTNKLTRYSWKSSTSRLIVASFF